MENTSSNGSSPLRAALENTGLPLKAVTVLAPQNDPFRLDTEAGHRDGKWLADMLEHLGIGRLHNRGVHYALFGHRKPDGTPYTSTDENWDWLCRRPLDCARWLGYIRFDRITDERNLPPVVRLWTPTAPQGWVNRAEIYVPEIDDEISISPGVQMKGRQPYHLILLGEKSSLKPALEGIADSYEADLYLPTGEISDSMIYAMAASSETDPRPMVVLYLADCDPSGHQMAISVSRKLQAFKVLEFPDMEFQMHRAALTPNQVRELQLPGSPLKATELRADKWRERMGVEQTEIDALATLRPDALEEIVESAIAPFYDRTLALRVSKAKREWLGQAQEVIELQLNHRALEQANMRLEALREHVKAEVEAINDTASSALLNDGEEIELPPIAVPEAADNSGDAMEPLIDSRWDFVNQCERLIASKQYLKLPPSQSP